MLIYVETTVPSFYFETRSRAVHQARRDWTREWWEIATWRDTLVTSQAVIEELERAPEPKRSKAISLLDPLAVVPSTPAVDELVKEYLANRLMPNDAFGDARHLALATFHGCDMLVRWNCAHLANPNKRRHIQQVNAAQGFPTPTIVTPIELLDLE